MPIPFLQNISHFIHVRINFVKRSISKIKNTLSEYFLHTYTYFTNYINLTAGVFRENFR